MARKISTRQPNQTAGQPATVQACAVDRAKRDQTGAAVTQHGAVYASAQDGIPRTTGGR